MESLDATNRDGFSLISLFGRLFVYCLIRKAISIFFFKGKRQRHIEIKIYMFRVVVELEIVTKLGNLPEINNSGKKVSGEDNRRYLFL